MEAAPASYTYDSYCRYDESYKGGEGGQRCFLLSEGCNYIVPLAHRAVIGVVFT